jgi:uncharacterized protein (TIGR02145 family)
MKNKWVFLCVFPLFIFVFACTESTENSAHKSHSDSSVLAKAASTVEDGQKFLDEYEKFAQKYMDALRQLSTESVNQAYLKECRKYEIDVQGWAVRWEQVAGVIQQNSDMSKRFNNIMNRLNLALYGNPIEISIGEQVWMGKNLNVEHFQNGDPVFYAQTNSEWEKAAKYRQPAYCYYNNNPFYGILYGKLYNWYAVNDSRKLAPSGWHIPKDDEWARMTTFLGGEEIAGNKIKSKEGWSESGNGINSSELNVLPGGFNYYMGSFKYLGHYGSCWSATQLDSLYAWGRIMYYFSDYISRNNFNKGYGFSVRCVKD